MYTTLAFGEVLWDVYSTSEHLGGATMNFAAHFKKCGGKAWILTALGDDLLGKKAIDEMSSLGIETEYVTFSEKETGKCLVKLSQNKIPSYDLLDNVAYDDIKLPKFGDKNFDVLYFGTLALRNENNRRVLKELISENKFNDLFVDVNIRPPYYSEAVIRFALENATIVKISDEELPVIETVINIEGLPLKESAQKLCEEFKNLKLVLITRGEKGALVYDSESRKSFECSGARVKVVSTVGAGDSFSASFLIKYLETKNIEVSLGFSTKISGYVVSQKDSIPDYDVRDFS